MTLDESLSNALVTLQQAQVTLEEAIAALTQHNNSTESHPDIRDIINNFLSSAESIYTRAQIVEIINEYITTVNNDLSEHVAAEATTAHPAIASMIEDLATQIADLQNRVSLIEDWKDGTDTATQTELEVLIKQVVDKYAPILAALQKSFKEAAEAGNTELANSIKASIEEALNQQTAEVNQVIAEWQEANTPSD